METLLRSYPPTLSTSFLYNDRRHTGTPTDNAGHKTDIKPSCLDRQPFHSDKQPFRSLRKSI
jgi:hypothetical protein